MAEKKTPARSSQGKSKSGKPARSARRADGVLRTNDLVAQQAGASDDFVAAMPYNSITASAFIDAIAAHRHPSRDSDPPLI